MRPEDLLARLEAGYEYDPMYGQLCNERDQLKAENAKLLELVTQMHTCLTRPKVYTGESQPYLIATECPYFTKGKCDYNSCGFEQRMRELGAKV